MSTRPKIWNGPAPVRPRLADKQWFRLQNIGSNVADLWIYDEIGGWGITAQNLVAELATMNVGQINVHLNSPGGDVFDGIAIMNSLRDHPANVTVTVDALAASIASVIAQAGDKVIMGRNSMMMVHNASGFAMGEGKDLRKMADLLDSTTENIASIYAERAGGTVKQWLAVMDEEVWYPAEEAVAAGLADEVAPLPTEQDARQMAAKWDLSNYAHAPKIEAVPGEEGTVGPGPGQYAEPHVYARDVQSGAGNCVCGGSPRDNLHVPSPLAPDPVLAWDPAAFKAALTTVAAEHNEPEPPPWDPSLFKAAVSLVTNNVPVPEPVSTPSESTGSVFDPGIFAAAMRKART